MSAMSVKVHKANLGEDIKYALVARAIQYGTESGAQPEEPFIQEFVVPAGTNEVKRIECPAGHYRIEVLLPSGDVVNQDVVVSPGEEANVDLNTGGSPQNWLSWQTLAGIVPSKASLQSAATATVDWVKRVAEDKGVELPSLEQIKSSPAFEAVTNAVVGQILEVSDPRASRLAGLVKDVVGAGKVTWNDLTKAVGTLSEDTTEGALLQYADRAETSLVADLHLREVGRPADLEEFWKRLGRSSAPIAREGRLLRTNYALSEDSSFYHWRVDATRRSAHFNRWAVVRHEFGIEIARLPFPWGAPKRHAKPISIEVLVDRRATYRPVRTTVTVADAEMGGLLSYMTAGSVAAGRLILHELVNNGMIESALLSKQTNPLAACAAGYCAIAISDEAIFEKWKPWIQNLMTRFPGIPDGAVIFAKRMLQTADDEKQLHIAKRAFMTAFRRGLPFFAAGVQHLQDGLFTFSGEDPEVERMYRSILKVTTRLDPGQPFTVLRYPKGKSA
ncbi:hypothetical protein [Bradyrhizobium sp. CCBAU 53338]|uniref:hypothetical protein n=1 Tax=Bradyrhizobium sp. CCBAU 53338 TaxID=1325111 RepID=UPI00188C7C31|nr:hypothetical protein [Bradyrhizobium sp. CCBAU 53338]QOZ51585.1 hypothetical protein XH90_09460 [Bradyrhizobium sp. CCBAU 53338]